MADRPQDAPEHCPGTSSEQAGKVSACQGCPNQTLCASGVTKAPDPAIKEIKERLASVKYKVLVLSGKGGVGKSTFSTQLARGIAEDKTKQVALLDIDICGPSIPRIMGLQGHQVHQSGAGWSLVFSRDHGITSVHGLEEQSEEMYKRHSYFRYVQENLGVMSVGFLLSSPNDAVIWRGPKKNGLIKQFLRDVNWGTVDYLVVDTPPGTSDEHLSIVQYLSETNLDGAVIITTPQEVSLQDVRKEINFCRKVNLPIIGVVENMSGFICPKCKNESQIFPPSTGGAVEMCRSMNVPFLAKLPLDPRLGRCCDEGKSFVTEVPDSAAALAFREIIQKIQEYCTSIKMNND